MKSRFNTRAAALPLLIAGLGICLQRSRLPSFFYEGVSLPLSFHVRERAGKMPALDPKLKLLAVDSRALSYYRREQLGESDWAAIFQKLASLGARVVLVDKVFGVASSDRSYDFRKLAGELPRETRFVCGSFVNQEEMPPRLPFPETGLPSLSSFVVTGDLPSWLSPEKTFVYGPDEHFRPLFTEVGHLNYGRLGRVRPFYRVGDRVLPHLAFRATDAVSFQSGEAILSGHAVPIDRAGYILPDFIDRSTLQKRTMSVPAIFTSHGPELVHPGDTVLVLSEMAIGGETDFVVTPIGRYENGFVLASITNSVLRGNWIRKSEFPGWVAFCLIPILALAAWFLPMGRALAAFTLIPAGLTLYQVTLLAVWAVDLDTSSAVLPGFLVGLSCFLLKARINSRRHDQLRRSLAGVIDATRLKALLSRPDRIQWRPSIREVTIVFIDMVGFSRMAEEKDPNEVYQHLRMAITRITETVHEFGGVVDRTLGDGVLAFFGYDFTDRPSPENHALKAVECACEIQRRHLLRIGQAPSELAHPLRIGVNSGKVLVGDLGDRQRVDFTVIGHAVNFAQRLEAACDDFNVLCSESTRGAVPTAHPFSPRFRRKLVPVKHVRGPVSAHQLDPLLELREMKLKVVAGYRKKLGLEREEARIAVPAGRIIPAVTSLFDGTITDFSLHGLQILGNTFVGKGTLLTVQIPGAEEALMEVRWSEPDDNGVVRVGLRYIDASLSRRQAFFDHLHQLASSDGRLGKTAA